MNEYGVLQKLILTGEMLNTGTNAGSKVTISPKLSCGLSWNQTRVSVVRGQSLTA